MRSSFIGLPALVIALVLTAPFGPLLGDARATTLVFLDVPAKAKGADRVVQGTVVSQASRWTGDNRRIITETVIDVAEVWKGEPVKQLKVRQPGGEIGDIGQRVDGVAKFTVGEEVVLFLEARPGGAWLLHGMGQGKYRVERSSDGKDAFAVPEVMGEARLVDPSTGVPSVRRNETMPLLALRAQVAQAVGEAPDDASPSLPPVRPRPEGK